MHQHHSRKLALLGLLGLSAALLAGCSSGVSQADFDALKQQVAAQDQKAAALQNQVSAKPDAAAVKKLLEEDLNTVPKNGAQNSSLDIWKVQPGLGTVMIEYNTRIANAWYAAEAGNWDMARYQVMEMTEIQEVGETTRPGRADDLKKFEQQQLDPLIKAAEAKDINAWRAQYPRTINGCNACHKNQTGGDFPNGYYFIKIVPPVEAATKNIDWKGQEPPSK